MSALGAMLSGVRSGLKKRPNCRESMFDHYPGRMSVKHAFAVIPTGSGSGESRESMALDA